MSKTCCAHLCWITEEALGAHNRVLYGPHLLGLRTAAHGNCSSAETDSTHCHLLPCLRHQARRATQVRFEAERGREGLQRQLAALDSHAHVLAQRLEDADLENHALTHKVPSGALRTVLDPPTRKHLVVP